MAPRLKVFVTSDGLTDFVVATSSRPKALAAWGVRQDLFQEGLAHETADPALVKAARAQPGEVLRRPAGSREALARAKIARPAKARAPSKAALKRVEALERRLAALDDTHRAALTQIAAARTALEARQAQAVARHEAARTRLTAELKSARASVS